MTRKQHEKTRLTQGEVLRTLASINKKQTRLPNLPAGSQIRDKWIQEIRRQRAVLESFGYPTHLETNQYILWREQDQAQHTLDQTAIIFMKQVETAEDRMEVLSFSSITSYEYQNLSAQREHCMQWLREHSYFYRSETEEWIHVDTNREK